MKKRMHIISVLAASVCMAGCGSDPAPSESSEPGDVAGTDSSYTPPNFSLVPPTPAAPKSDIGKPINNNGAIVTVRKVRSARSIQLNDGTKSAQSGGRFVIVGTTVTNKARGSMDLTCGLPIANYLVDTDGTQYDPIENLYEIPGNPECNAALNPGFSDKMTWIFEVPSDVKLAGMTILENYRYRDPSQATLIHF